MAPQREWFEKDYYKVLGVAESADQKEITRAYRKLARENHPDKKQGDADAEERFKEISAAYDVVGDAEKRKEYDEVRKLGPVGPGFGGPGGGFGGPGGYTFTADDLGGAGGGIGDILGNLFGGRMGGRGTASRGTGPQRGADLEASLHLDFTDAVRGITTVIHLTSDASCSTCHGWRAALPCRNARPMSATRRCHSSGRDIVSMEVGPTRPAGIETGVRDIVCVTFYTDRRSGRAPRQARAPYSGACRTFTGDAFAVTWLA